MNNEGKKFSSSSSVLFPDPTKFFLKRNTVILVSNSSLDGFKEGDGDLMQKLVESFHQNKYLAKRVIENDKSVPQDTNRDLLEILASKDESLSNKQQLRERFLLIISKYLSQGHKIILYIGSRLDSVDDSKVPPVLSGSGSFFEKDLLVILKKLNVKIVICCLEYKFFKRSHWHMSIALEMHRQQLFLADRIHFLTVKDQEDFLETLSALGSSSILEPSRVLPLPSLAQQDSYDLSEEIKTVSLEDIGRKTHFIPGIYTLSPLEDKTIFTQGESSDQKIIDFLAERPNNIFWFGLIRSRKGIEESIELAKIFAKESMDNKVLICGTVMFDSIFYLCHILTSVYGVSKNNVKKEMKAVLSQSLELTTLPPKSNVSNIDLSKYEEIFGGNKVQFNTFCRKVFHAIKNKYDLHDDKRIEFHFNLPESEVQQLTLKCRWAIKLDHKGMASNASSIVSCLGCYLPTFTTIGLVTDDYFIPEKSFFSGPLRWWPTPGQYSKTVIMPEEKYQLVDEKGRKEIQPGEIKLELIINIMQQESKDVYKDRLNQLRTLKKSGFYSVSTVADKIIENVFKPLAAEQAIINQQKLEKWKSSLLKDEKASKNPEPLIKYVERQQILHERLELLNKNIKQLRKSTSYSSVDKAQEIAGVEQEFKTIQAEYEEACQILRALMVEAIPGMILNTLKFG